MSPLVILPSSNIYNSVVIWLHGLGADGSDFLGLVDQIYLPEDHAIKFIFPNAPYRSVTVNNGMVMRAWYDIFGLDLSFKEDVDGIKQTNRQIKEFIQQELDHGISGKKIILGGFSQGGAISLYTGLRLEQPIGGIIALSSYQVLRDALSEERSKASNEVPIFMAHGIFDPVVPYSIGEGAYKQLLDLDYSVKWFSYAMQHTLVPEEIVEISNFIKEVLL